LGAAWVRHAYPAPGRAGSNPVASIEKRISDPGILFFSVFRYFSEGRRAKTALWILDGAGPRRFRKRTSCIGVPFFLSRLRLQHMVHFFPFITPYNLASILKNRDYTRILRIGTMSTSLYS